MDAVVLQCTKNIRMIVISLCGVVIAVRALKANIRQEKPQRIGTRGLENFVKILSVDAVRAE